MKFDHVAITTTVEKIKETVDWYVAKTDAAILYLDESWGLIETHDHARIAFVVKGQHPPHIAFNISEERHSKFLEQGRKFKKHRDGSESFYAADPSGNFVEFLKWPKVN